jgi:HEAT repeat protein
MYKNWFGIFLIIAAFAGLAGNGIAANIKGKQASERGRAADELGRRGKADDLRALAAALKTEKNKEARMAMINALGSAGSAESIAAVRPFLGDEDRELRLQAAAALAEAGSAEGLAELERVAVDIAETSGRRSYAVRSLGGIPGDDATAVLAKLLNDQHNAIRLQAVASLGRIGTAAARGLVENMRNDTDEQVRILAETIVRKGNRK